jgi:hypothetical protein
VTLESQLAFFRHLPSGATGPLKVTPVSRLIFARSGAPRRFRQLGLQLRPFKLHGTVARQPRLAGTTAQPSKWTFIRRSGTCAGLFFSRARSGAASLPMTIESSPRG